MLAIVALSAFGAVPTVTASPIRRPVVLSTGIAVEPLATPAPATVVPEPLAPTASTGSTVQ